MRLDLTLRNSLSLQRRHFLLGAGIFLLGTCISHGLFAQASVVSGSVTTSKTSAYVPGVGNNRLLVVSISGEVAGIGDVSSVTWGGQSLTLAVNLLSGTANRISIWYLKEADIVTGLKACSYNFVVTWSATAPTNEVFAAYTLENVDQTTPIPAGTSTNTGQSANAASIALAAVTTAGQNDIVCYASASNNDRTHTASTGYTELSDQVVATTTAMATAAKQITATGNESPTATWTTPNSRVFIVGVVFNGITNSGATTYYSLASGAWDLNTSWSLSADGSTGAVPVGVWPERMDNVVIRSGHNITVNAVNDNKYCGISPDALGRTNVGPVLATAVFYQTGDILINGTLTVAGVGIMVEGYTRITSGGTLSLGSSLVNLGYLETDASLALTGTSDLILSGRSTTIINANVTIADDLMIDFTSATLCGTGTIALTTNGSSQISYLHSATVAQICSSLPQITCPNGGCTNAPATGTGTVLQGNTGPGGVGDNTNNRLWLRANDLSLANNDNVTSWADVSGNNLTASQGVAANQPRFVTSSVNGFPSIRFDGTLDGTNDFLNMGNPSVLNLIPGTDSWSFFVVYNVPAGTQGTLFSKATDADRQYLYTIDDNGTSRFTSYIGGDGDIGSHTATGAWFVSAHTNNTTQKNSWTNENSNFTNQGVGTDQSQTCDVLIGARRDTGPTTGTGFMLAAGNIAEIVMYNKLVNTTQRMIIDNYLAAKYDIGLLAANEIYTMDNSGNGHFDFDVAGIGQVSTTDYHRDAKGSGIVRMWNPSGLGNNEFLMWGHDNTALYSSTTAGVGAPIEERLSRTWRVSEAGDVGTVSVSFDISLLGTPLGSNLRLLIDRDGDGFSDNDVTPVAGSFVGNTVVFSGVNFQNDDKFTLGNTDVDDPLPIELISFRAVAEKSMVHLSWTTASEANNDFFTVERSKNAHDWEVVQHVPGAGTTQKKNHYETVDDGPYRGASYYRLKQTDFDLQSQYSDLVRVVVDHEAPVMLHPNPFHDRFSVLIDFEPAQSQVKLYNSSGAEIPFTMKKEGENLAIEPGNIPQGLYILKVLDRFVVRTAKVVKVQAR